MACGERGFTIIEVIVAALVLLIGVLSLLALFNRANAATLVDRQREGATSLAREITEGARSVPFDDLVSTESLNAELQAMPGLEDLPAGSPYTVMRRGTAFTVVTSVCTVDDGKDGGGSQPITGNFCPDSTTAGTTDANPEDYRRVTATVSWTNQGVNRSVTQTGIVNNPGNGPSVLSVAPDGSAAPYEITAEAPTLTIKITTSSPAEVVNWSVDGTKQVTTPDQSDGTAQLWAVDWPIETLDEGPYVISADAYDANGLSGSSRTETITLNRFPPRQPAHVAGGRNGRGSVDIEWSANTERDIIGYEVRRTDASGTQVGPIVCGFVAQKLDTTCVDSSPPAADPLSDPLYYQVRAYDKAPGTGMPRAGEWSAPPKVVTTNPLPFRPVGLTATTAFPGSSSAVVTLRFGRPAPQGPDADDSIAFFRIYRDGTDVSDRYDRWFGAADSITWEDIRTDGLTHTYYVTAVDTHYGESAMVGPVTGG